MASEVNHTMGEVNSTLVPTVPTVTQVDPNSEITSNPLPPASSVENESGMVIGTEDDSERDPHLAPAVTTSVAEVAEMKAGLPVIDNSVEDATETAK